MLKLAAGLALVMFLAGCASHHSSIDARVYRMGERVQVGPLIYTVLEVQNGSNQELNPDAPDAAQPFSDCAAVGDK